MNHPQSAGREMDVAIIGMAVRLPGAASVSEFWRNLCDCVESISFPSKEELLRMGVPPETLRDPRFVGAVPLLKDIDCFDANFFGYAPREAEMLDPQQRLFLECAWESLEAAGYCPNNYDGLIGIYAGASVSSYLLYNLLPNLPDRHSEDNFEAMIGNDKDFLSTRIAYKLNLKGPAITVQTGCSTSLVAVHQACQALLTCQLDMALAGGVSVHVPQRAGYYYQENGINSPDGHCRPFDARSQGTLFGSGMGIVVLKRFADALQDGDCIHAVIRGSAINNDGAQKVGYTAPSVEGQAAVIHSAQAIAGVEPGSISYVECHGTATALGDSVEFQALNKVFGGRTALRQFCALGSVKSNLGHLDAAAGVTGLIKTVLALKNRRLPPSLHFDTPNPGIDFETSPFYLSQKLSPWGNGTSLLRAGVSSFGIGGTNAHIVLEEAPEAGASGPSRSFQLLLLSAKSASALEISTANLIGQLKKENEKELPDTAYTLAVGRKHWAFRRAAICSDIKDAIATLECLDPRCVFTLQHEPSSSPITFMFAGGGAQYVNMGLDLYNSEPLFRQEIDSSAETLGSLLGADIREYMFPTDNKAKWAAAEIKKTGIGLPALFIVQHALAKLWMSWGVTPQSLIGHSLGEYTAAALAGVFSKEDALTLVVTRSRLLEQLPAGAMTSVHLNERELIPFITKGLSLAAINGEAQCVVSGPTEEVDSIMAVLEEQEIECRRVQIDVASHSWMVDPILGPFRAFLKTLKFNPPRIRYVSNVTGQWITAQDAQDPEYWVQHLRQPVLFGLGIKELLKNPRQTLLEVGPGHTLSTLAKMQMEEGGTHVAVPSMRHPYDRQSDVQHLLTSIGKLWLAGVPVDWAAFYRAEKRKRKPLPSYPFERRRYWVEPPKEGHNRARQGKIPNIDEWFYLPSWKLATPLLSPPKKKENDQRTWLVFAGDDDVSHQVAGMQALKGKVAIVSKGSEFRKISQTEYSINPSAPHHYVELLEKLRADGLAPGIILHGWSLDCGVGEKADFTRKQQDIFFSLIYLAQALGQSTEKSRISLWMVGNGMYAIEGTDRIAPGKAMLLAPCLVIPQEFENVACRCIDVGSNYNDGCSVAGRIVREIKSGATETVVAYRGRSRWVRTFEPVSLDEAADTPNFPRDGTYLITGGLGGVGLQLAEHLSGVQGTSIALTTRSSFPEKEQWAQWLLHHGEDDAVSVKIRRLMGMEAQGCRLMVLSADVTDIDGMQNAVARVRQDWGEITGFIHMAGISGVSATGLISDLTEQECELHFQAKIRGLGVLEDIVRQVKPQFCILFSSNASVLGGPGLLAYTASNLYMDAFAQSRAETPGTHWISVNWDGWLLEKKATLHPSLKTSLQRYAMTPAESWQAFVRVFECAPPGQIVVSTGDLSERMKLWVEGQSQHSETADSAIAPQETHARPALGTAYVAPASELETTVLTLWQKMLGIENIGIHDNFFELGGNSLIGIRMIASVKEKLKISIPIMALFQGPTVAALCEVIQQKQNSTAALEESRARGEKRRENNVEKQGAACGMA